ncbi:MAG: hypothetical protein A2W05_11225 [Candidatus Schekmanbacteria bacterium RBG_16_38_10]|uniref:Uncharacterized protein n=1 Tax=Candidatus Schekmanbacteria bacterium RBG_16_38_10 TaxID=1817879 RepID=A0A1F7S1H1_9BACT|nr:MAG: hypothetical protein A2W05_11225 [Candidatus Schekmanbacteria bacterium RBG_16_38_10]
MGPGVDIIWGITDSDKTELQAIRFDKTKFSPEECKIWLKEHDMKPIEFEPAVETATEDSDNTILLDQAQFHVLRGVEIFRTGTWKGRHFVESDLDEMVTNWSEFKHSWFQPAVKDGHHFEPGKPALGYLDNVRRVGQKLVADLIELPVKVYEMIRDKRYDRVSAEIAPNLEKNGKKYKWVLSALAILGPEIPEVTGLKPLRECFTKENNIEEYELENGLVQMAEWSSEYVTDLPDEAFAIILDGGEKDTEGKTKLRSLRKLPHHNSNVKSGDENDSVDLPHLRNAIARLPQVNMSLEQKKETLSHLQAHAVAANEGHNYNWDNLYAQFEQKIDKGGSKMNEEELKALVLQFETKIKEYEEKIQKYEADIKGKAAEGEPDKIKVLVNQLSETQTKLLNAMETVKTNEKKVIELEEQGRKNRIQAKLDTLRVPAFKFYAEQFYDWATKSGEEVIKFSRDGVIKEVLKEQVVDEFVGLINKATDNLFIQHSKVDIFKRDDVPGDDNPKDEVARRIDIYMKEHLTTTYSQAMDVVLTADPMLKEAYAKS